MLDFVACHGSHKSGAKCYRDKLPFTNRATNYSKIIHQHFAQNEAHWPSVQEFFKWVTHHDMLTYLALHQLKVLVQLIVPYIGQLRIK